MHFVRGFAVFLFYLSQLFAPLVHAHVGVDLSPSALHLPGLEEAATPHDLTTPATLKQRDGLVVRAAKGVRQSQALPFSPSVPMVTSTGVPRPEEAVHVFVPPPSSAAAPAPCSPPPPSRAPPR